VLPVGQGEGTKALEYYRKALEIAEELRRRNPQSADYARDLSVSYDRMGDLYRGLGEGPKALEYYRKALELREELRRRNPQSADYTRDLAFSHGKLGEFFAQSDRNRAVTRFEKARLLLEQLDEEGRLPDEKARQVLDHIRKRLRELCVD
jgi:tetratricopeptide (TPR) repeat protein